MTLSEQVVDSVSVVLHTVHQFPTSRSHSHCVFHVCVLFCRFPSSRTWCSAWREPTGSPTTACGREAASTTTAAPSCIPGQSRRSAANKEHAKWMCLTQQGSKCGPLQAVTRRSCQALSPPRQHFAAFQSFLVIKEAEKWIAIFFILALLNVESWTVFSQPKMHNRSKKHHSNTTFKHCCWMWVCQCDTVCVILHPQNIMCVYEVRR